MSPASPRRANAIGLGLALLVWALCALRADFLIDDAFISFRYARNWVELGAPVFNPGEAPPVEGYSNFLWVLILRVAYALGLPLPGVALGLGYLFAAACIVLVHRLLVRRHDVGAVPAALGAAALAFTPTFSVWTTGGLETALFTLLLLGTHSALTAPGDEHEKRIGLLAGLGAVGLALCRVEGFLWVLGVAVCALPLLNGAQRKRLAPYFGLYLAGFGTFLVWRHAMYGEWLANTVRAKAGLSGASLRRGLVTDASWLLNSVAPALVLLQVPLQTAGPRRRLSASLAGMILGALAYNAVVGGDWMPFYRFLAPAAPFVALLLGLFAARSPVRLAGALVALLSLAQGLYQFDVHLAPESWRKALSFREFRSGHQTEWQRHEQGDRNLAQFGRIGRGLRQVAQPGESLTFGAIGALGWFADELVIHDRNGLVDREVAARPANPGARSAGHDKNVPRAFFLERGPTYVHALWVESLPEGADPNAVRDQAAAGAMRFIQSQGGETALRSACLPELHPLPSDRGHPDGGALLMFRVTDDAAGARAYWNALLGPE